MTIGTVQRNSQVLHKVFRKISLTLYVQSNVCSQCSYMSCTSSSMFVMLFAPLIVWMVAVKDNTANNIGNRTMAQGIVTDEHTSVHNRLLVRTIILTL